MEYMSDAILNEAKVLDKKHQVSSKRLKRKRPAENIKPIQERQRESLEEGLTTPINQQNKGYQLLLKMGYKQGTGLGKDSHGIQEPLPIHIRQDRSGIGDLQAAKKSERYDPKRRKIEEINQKEFKTNIKEKKVNKKSIEAIIKIVTQVCPQLDEQKEISDNPLLQEYRHLLAPTQKRTCQKCFEPLVSKNGRFGEFFICKNPTCKYKRAPEEGDGEGMDFLEYFAKFSVGEQMEKLEKLLKYLRETHYYCFYCGAIYDDADQLEKMCPGLWEEGH